MILCYGCASNSEAEMQAAQQAMDKAKSFHAEDLAASNFSDAMQVWDQGQTAVKQGKSAKTLFLRAKSRFEKAAVIAKSQGDMLSRDVSDMQMKIGERLSNVKAVLLKGRLSSKIQKQIQTMVAEVEQGAASIENLMSQGDFLKARNLAKEIQTKIYNAELVMAGKKPTA
jgi:hypothetical protein